MLLFPSAEVALSPVRRVLVSNVTLQARLGGRPSPSPNECLNGRYTVQGVLENECLRNSSPIRSGDVAALLLRKSGRRTALLILFVELLQILPSPKNPTTHRSYNWLFAGLHRPPESLGLSPADYETDLLDLLEAE